MSNAGNKKVRQPAKRRNTAQRMQSYVTNTVKPAFINLLFVRRLWVYLVSLAGLLFGHIISSILISGDALSMEQVLIIIMVLLPLATMHYMATVEEPNAAKVGLVFILTLTTSLLTCSLSYRDTLNLRRENTELRRELSVLQVNEGSTTSNANNILVVH